MIDLTKQNPERGYFSPSSTMLALTDKFLQVLKEKVDKEVTYQQVSNNDYLIRIEVDTNIYECYHLHNDGIEAYWQYQGLSN